MPDYPNAYGLEGFTDKDFSVIIKDRYDLWEFFLTEKQILKTSPMVFGRKIKFRLTRINSIKTLEVSKKCKMYLFLPLMKTINNQEFSKLKFHRLKIRIICKWEISTAIEI